MPHRGRVGCCRRLACRWQPSAAPNDEGNVNHYWVALLIAAGLEIVWAVGLEYTEGFTRLWRWGAQRTGQPAVLGELVAGVVLGTPVLGVVDPKSKALPLLAEIGVVILLFEIGQETDLRKLLLSSFPHPLSVAGLLIAGAV